MTDIQRLKQVLAEIAQRESTTRTVKLLPPLKAGDKVTRYLAGEIPMPMVVLSVTPELITCGGPDYPGADWTFDPKTGSEIDERFDWGPPPKMTGSYITVEERGEA